MARPTEQKPWHADALRMRAEGVPFAKIATALNVNQSTLKAFCKRSSKDAERQTKILLQDKTRPAFAPLTVPENRVGALVDMLLLIEQTRAQTILTAMGAIDAFQKLTEAQMETKAFKLAMMKMQAGIETIKAMKGSGSLIEIDPAMGQGPGGRPGEERLVFEVVDPAPQELSIAGP